MLLKKYMVLSKRSKKGDLWKKASNNISKRRGVQSRNERSECASRYVVRYESKVSEARFSLMSACPDYVHSLSLSLNSRSHVMTILPAEVRRSASGWGSLWESSSFVPWLILNNFRDVSLEWFWSGPGVVGSWGSHQALLVHLVCKFPFCWILATTS